MTRVPDADLGDLEVAEDLRTRSSSGDRDPTILAPSLVAAGAPTMTLFALHMPVRLFDMADGSPCIEVLAPPDLEHELRMPRGNIFHGDLAWPFAEDSADAGRWGVETDDPSILVCGSGARRGGAVSAIGGHNAAMAVLDCARMRRK